MPIFSLKGVKQGFVSGRILTFMFQKNSFQNFFWSFLQMTMQDAKLHSWFILFVLNERPRMIFVLNGSRVLLLLFAPFDFVHSLPRSSNSRVLWCCTLHTTQKKNVTHILFARKISCMCVHSFSLDINVGVVDVKCLKNTNTNNSI